MTAKRGRTLATLGFVALVGWVFLPWTPFSYLGTANLALRHTLVCASLVLLTGWVGQISMAQAAFVGIGAFVTGVLARNWGIVFPFTLPLAAAVTAGTAALLGLVALRVRGLYLAVATLIFAWMAQEYLFNQSWFGGVGGSSSITNRPIGEEGSLPYFDFTDRRTFYLLILAVVLFALYAIANLRDSKTGRAWFAVRGSEVAAASLGIDVTRYKLLAFAVSGCLTGMAGSLLLTNQQVVTSGAFSIQISFFYLAMAVVGGLSSLGGAVAGAVLFASLEEVFFRVEALQGLLDIVSSALLAVVLLFFPSGLAGIPSRVREGLDRIGPHLSATAVGRFATAFAQSLRSWPRMREQVAATPGAERRESPTESDEDMSAVEVHDGVDEHTRRVGHVTVPDALEEALTLKPIESVAQGLKWEPGTATKVALPARRARSPVLAASGITVRFGGLTAVGDATVEVREGEIVGLIGPNGAGKTTLFNAISGLNQPTEGTVALFGDDVTDLDVHERARRGMGRTFQVIQLFGALSVFDNLLVATHARNQSTFLSHLTASDRAMAEEIRARDRVRQVIELIGLEEIAERPVAGLPFGTLRLVEIARALVTGAPFIMLDEPASGLDNAETDRFMDLLFWVRQSLGVSILVIEHDVRMVTSVCDYIYVLDRGTMIADGTPARIQRNAKVIAAYLGEVSKSSARPRTGGPDARRSATMTKPR